MAVNNYQQQQLDPYDAVAELAAADCNLDLAAEILTRKYGRPVGQEIRPADIITLVAADPLIQENLFNHLRIKAAMNAYVSMNMAHTVLSDADVFSNFEAKDMIAAYNAFSTAFGAMANPSKQTSNTFNMGSINIMDKVMAMMPPDAREAVKVLAQTQADPVPLGTDEPTPMRRSRGKQLSSGPSPDLVINGDGA